MKKNKKIIMLLVVGLLLVSCGKKEEKVVENLDIKKIQSKTLNLVDNNIKIINLTKKEQELLLSKNIDPYKVSKAITEANEGNTEAIISLSKLYYDLKDMEKLEKYLKMGVEKNIPEAIYNLAILYKEKGKIKEAEKLFLKLPKSNKMIKIQLGAEEYNKGIKLIKEKKYEEAKKMFEEAYKKGLKDADIQIAVLNKELKNKDEAIKWYKIASKRGVKGAALEIGAILFDSGKVVEARPYLEKEYKNGNKSLAMPIAISYDKENKIEEALKWYKIAAKNGVKDAEVAVKEIEKNLNSTKYILGKFEKKKNDEKKEKTGLRLNNNLSNIFEIKKIQKSKKEEKIEKDEINEDKINEDKIK